MIYYDKAERSRILADLNIQKEMLSSWNEEHSEDPSEQDLAQLSEITKKVSELADRYVNMTPVVPMSRCPYTREVAYHSIDLYGLDGPWWDYSKPLRPVEDLPVTFFTVTGSMKLGENVENTRQQARPGPEAPYVIKQLIGVPGIKAVISTVKVGDHTGYPVFYYSENVNPEVEPARNWGQYMWQRMDRDGRYVHLVPDETEFDYDFDLTKWVKEGKLYWIAPSDPTFTLRNGVDDCPYLSIGGGHEFQIIIDGEVTIQTEEEQW